MKKEDLHKESREQFETWFKDGNKTPLERNKNGFYVYMPAHAAWTAWQASRKAMLR